MWPTETNSCKLSDHVESDGSMITKILFHKIRSPDFSIMVNFIFIYKTSSSSIYGGCWKEFFSIDMVALSQLYLVYNWGWNGPYILQLMDRILRSRHRDNCNEKYTEMDFKEVHLSGPTIPILSQTFSFRRLENIWFSKQIW